MYAFDDTCTNCGGNTMGMFVVSSSTNYHCCCTGGYESRTYPTGHDTSHSAMNRAQRRQEKHTRHKLKDGTVKRYQTTKQLRASCAV